MDRLFKAVDNVVWDMMTGRVGFKTEDGICSVELGAIDPANLNEAPDAQVTVNMFDDFGMTVPAFAQSIPAASITMGDMIYSSSSNKVMGWVVKRNESGKSFKVMKQDGTRSDWVPPKVGMVGFDSGIMVLRSLMNMLPGGASGLSSMQGMMMPMMMMSQGDSDFDMKSMIPMMLMSQMGAMPGMPDGSVAPAGNAMSQMMPMMMMMQMMKGSSSGSSGKGGGKKDFFGG